MEARVASLESKQFSNKNSVKILENTVEQNNSAVMYCMETLDNERVNAVEKVPNESSNTDSIHTNEVNNKEN